MKKTVLLFVIGLLMASCSGPMGPRGYDGSDGLNGLNGTNGTNGTNWKIVDLVVNNTEWIRKTDVGTGLNGYYTCKFTMPEISTFIFNSGTVLCYIKIDPKQQVLPYVRHYENNLGKMWTKTIDYDFLPGEMNLYVTNSDFFNEIPETMRFRVVLMW